MKLRDKKTGEIKDWDFSNWYQTILNPENKEKYECNLNDFIDRTVKFREEWEDYEPKEPLIKDEKIRKAVRAWAEAVGRKDLLTIKNGGRLEISDGSPHLIYISFHADEATLKSLDDRTYYTIAELCGEEEE